MDVQFIWMVPNYVILGNKDDGKRTLFGIVGIGIKRYILFPCLIKKCYLCAK